MPPKAASNASAKTYSADVVAALLVATGTTSLSMRNYELMSSMDGTKTAAAFQHDFRGVLAKAKDLKTRIDKGELFEPVQSSAKRAFPFTLLFSTLSPQHSSVLALHLASTYHYQHHLLDMAKTTDTPAGDQKMISADCVAVLLMSNPKLSKAQYDMMSAVDGTRSASSFEHQFRSILAKAKDLKKRADDGEAFSPVAGAKRGTTTATPTTPASSKKRKGDGADDTPSKKPKAAAKPRGKKAQSSQIASPTLEDEDDDDLPADMADFIKAEKKWEEDFKF
ncbi:hypothetical protein E8E13_004564 [Curvularia kusanoi]|uniref:Uncharacterized protein n=1 Tax=Curvularia kusanoi TaxID=90978 RepID=A0A9P4WAH9_CURKU|nr:hypothetical protein E8E13_004564 [Curvularia kusanoi]